MAHGLLGFQVDLLASFENENSGRLRFVIGCETLHLLRTAQETSTGVATPHAMKLSLLIQSLGVGGTERQFIRLAESLNARGHEVRIFYLHSYDPGWQGIRKDESLQIHSLLARDPRGFLSKGLQYLMAVRALRRTLGAEGTQIAQTADTGVMASILSLATLGHPELVTVWGQRGAGRFRERKRWALQDRISTRLNVAMSHRVAALVSNSEAGRDAMKQYGFRCRTFPVVANGIDSEEFSRDDEGRRELRAKWGIGATTPLVGFVGRPVPVKGLDDYLGAVALLVDRRPDVRFVVVGGKDRRSQRPYRQLANSLGIEQFVSWELSRSDMPAVFSALDLLCLSSWAEGSPNVIAEAMACGTPCVATDVGTVAETVLDLGVVVPPRSAEALAAGLERGLANLSAVDRSLLREAIVSRYDLERHADEMEQLYTRLLDAH